MIKKHQNNEVIALLSIKILNKDHSKDFEPVFNRFRFFINMAFLEMLLMRKRA